MNFPLASSVHANIYSSGNVSAIALGAFAVLKLLTRRTMQTSASQRFDANYEHFLKPMKTRNTKKKNVILLLTFTANQNFTS